MSNVEQIHFKIGLAGTYWDKRPIYSILINDRVVHTREVVVDSGETFYTEFDTDLEEGPCTLKIRLENKHWTDTVENEDKTEILKDMLLHIKTVEIDEIDLANLLWTKTLYVPDDKQYPEIDKCVDLGWNGTWTLPFESPFYIWLLENI